MTTKTQEQIEREIAKLNENLNIIKVLRNLGVNKADAEKFLCNTPRIYSGYSMGETVSISYLEKKGKDAYYTHYILEENHCESYAKSCKWKPQHGYVKIVFTKKSDVKAFIKACNERNVENTWKLIKPNLSENSRICKGNIENIRIFF